MASPTVEMGLGGSLRALAASYGYGYAYTTLRVAQVPSIVSGVWSELIPMTSAVGSSVSGSWLATGGTLSENGGALTRGASALPEGGVSLASDGAATYLFGSAAAGAAGTSAASLEAVVEIAAAPGVGVNPLIWGNSEFGMQYRSDGRVHAIYNGSSVASTAASTGAVVHLALTRSGASPDSVKLYVNGSSTTATPARVSFADVFASAGRHDVNAHYLSAEYSFLAVYAGELSAANVAAHYAALSWTDVTADTLGGRGMVIERGIRDDNPSNRVASTGTLTFAMNNLANNSGGVTGYYAPGHASCRAGFGKGTPVRVLISSFAMFVGRIRAIAVEPGMTGVASRVLVTDYMDTVATFLLENAPIMENVTGDQVFEQIVGLIPNQPLGVTAYTGTETYTLALDNTRDEAVSALQEFHRLAVSELGYIYVHRNGRLIYEARGTRITNAATASLTLSDTMHGLDVAEVSSSSLNRVQITVHPRDIDAAATTVLFEITNALEIAAGETKTIMGPYRADSSPGITTRVGGLNMVTPVASTDYAMNVASDGTGTDLTASLSVVANFGANGVQFVLTNNATEPAFITLLQCRGKGVYDFRTVVVRSQDDVAIAADGVNALDLDMVYQENPNVAQAMADDLRAKYGDLSGTRARRVDILPDSNGAPAGVITANISARVAVSETRSGVTGEYYINGVRLEFQSDRLNRVSWWLTPASPVSYWILGQSGASELGTTTYPAPA